MIPYAGGLQQELFNRKAKDVSASLLGEHMAPDRIHKLTQYKVVADGEELGILEVNTYPLAGITRVAHVTFRGRVPGYINPVTGKEEIGMTATDKPTLEPPFGHDFKLGQPNNTPENPLYRHDGHTLRLADYEVDGRERRVLQVLNSVF